MAVIAQPSISEVREHSPFAGRGAPEWAPFPRLTWPRQPSGAAFTWFDNPDLEVERGDRFAALADEELDPFLGAWVYFQLRDVRKWVHRRVETIQIIGTESVRRRVSVDFNLPRIPDKTAQEVTIAPFAVLLKDAIADFDMRDEANQALPILNRYQNQYVALSVLYAVALAILGEGTPVPRHVMRLLATITYGDSQDAKSALSELSHTSVEAAHLLSNGVFSSLCETFKRKFLLLVPLRPEDGERRVLRFSYLQSLDQHLAFRDRAGWRPSVMHIDLPAVDEAGSYHFEMEIPEGLEVAQSRRTVRDPAHVPESGDASDAAEYVYGRIWAKAPVRRSNQMDLSEPEPEPQPSWWRRRANGIKKAADALGIITLPENVPEGEKTIAVEVKVRGKRVHFKMEGLSSGTDAFAEVWFRRSFVGFLRAARFYALYVTFVLFAILYRVTSVQPRAGTTVLLSLSGLVSLFVVRSNEHSLASRLLVVARVLVWMLAGVVYGAAILIVVGVEGSTLTMWWLSLSVGALMITVVLTAIAKFRHPGPRREKPALSVASAEGNLIAVGNRQHAQQVAHGLTRLLDPSPDT